MSRGIDRARIGTWLRRPPHQTLVAVLAVGVLLRLVFMYVYRPALLGFPDTSIYIGDASVSPFFNGTRPAGYGRFLAFLHDVWPHLTLVPLVQHCLGLATAVLLWRAVRRAGASAWAALAPAAIVALGGAGLFLEHAVLTEAPFTFLVAVALLGTIEASRAERPLIAGGWAALAGIAIAAAVTLRLPALVLAALLAGWLLLVRGVPLPTRLLRAGALIAIAAGGMLGYAAWYEHGTGHFGFTMTGFVNSYGRVGPFADCSRFDPPAGTRKLCIDVPAGERWGHDFWLFDAHSPFVKAYGPPLGLNPPESASREVTSFVRAAILHQPFDYLEQVGRDAWRIVNPGAKSSPRGNAGAGYGPQELIDSFFDAGWVRNALFTGAAAYWRKLSIDPATSIRTKGMGFLRNWERVSRFTGVQMVLLLLLAFAAPFIAPPRLRAPALLFAAAAAILLLVPILASAYDARYVVPALGPLAMAAGLGVQGLLERRRMRLSAAA